MNFLNTYTTQILEIILLKTIIGKTFTIDWKIENTTKSPTSPTGVKSTLKPVIITGWRERRIGHRRS